jgi:Tol biopolymer transport system component
LGGGSNPHGTTATTDKTSSTTAFRPGLIGTALPRTPGQGLIAFYAFSNKASEDGIWLVAPDGSGLREIEATGSVCTVGCGGTLRWDGKAILFSDDGGLKSENIDGTSERTIDPNGGCQAGCDWSPDGRSVVYGSGQDVVVAAANGSDPKEIGVGSSPSWSPDGELIAFNDPSSNVVLFDVKSQTTRVVAIPQASSSPLYGTGGTSFDPSSSRIIMFLAGKLEIVDLASGSLEPVCSKSGIVLTNPSWSPDGKSIVFDTPGLPLADHLAVCDIATGTIRSLPQVGYSEQIPSWR